MWHGLYFKHKSFYLKQHLISLSYTFVRNQYLYELLDALITAQTSSELAEKKLGVLASSLAGKLRSLAAKVQEMRGTTDQLALRSALQDYENALEL